MPYGENSSCNGMLKTAMTHKGDVRFLPTQLYVTSSVKVTLQGTGKRLRQLQRAQYNHSGTED